MTEVVRGPWGDGIDGEDDADESTPYRQYEEHRAAQAQPPAPAAGRPVPALPQAQQLYGQLDRAMRYARLASTRAVTYMPAGSAHLRELLDGYQTLQDNIGTLAQRLQSAQQNAVQGPGADLVDIARDTQSVEQQVQSYVESVELALKQALGREPPPVSAPGPDRVLSGASGNGRAFNPMWLALGFGVALTGVAVWQARKTDADNKKSAGKAKRLGAGRPRARRVHKK